MAKSTNGPETQPTLVAPTLLQGDFGPPGAEAVNLSAVGQTFGKYLLLAELGRGGMGVVFKARQPGLDRLVAVKMILNNHLATPELVARFHAEARAAARLQHPHIVQIYETDQVNGQHYFAMEYIEGLSLQQLQGGQPLPAEQAVKMLLPIVNAVAHLHARGIIHRDLKPSNILIDTAGRPVLTDFGLAKFHEGDCNLTSTGAILGTPSYMAPEQAAGKKEVGTVSDVYSLGAILYELLTGRPPFKAANPFDTLVQVLEGEPPLPRQLNPAVPRKLELICLKCLDKDASKRYVNAAELRDELQRFLDGEPVQAQPQTWQERVLRWMRRQPALASHLGILILGSLFHEVGYWLHADIPWQVHLVIQSLVLVWAVLCIGLQRCRVLPWGDAVPYVWAGVDVTFITLVLLLTGGINEPTLVLYPLYVVAAGLWFLPRLVTWATTVSVIGYAALFLTACLGESPPAHPHRHVIFLVALVLIGFITGYQVQRVRILSRFSEQRLGG